METINHNVVWSLINHAKRINRELDIGKIINNAQVKELLAVVKELQEKLDDTGK